MRWYDRQRFKYTSGWDTLSEPRIHKGHKHCRVSIWYLYVSCEKSKFSELLRTANVDILCARNMYAYELN